MVGRGQILCSLPVIRSKGNFKTSKQLYWCPDKYIQAFISVIQTFQLTWKDIMLLLDQTLVSLEKQWVLAQATQVKNVYHLQWATILVAPGNKEINVPTYRGTGRLLDRSTLKGDGDMAQAVECHFAGIKPWVQIQYSQKQKKLGAEEAAQWENVCPACAKPWVQFPSIGKSKKKVRKITGINVTSAIS
jgi:hypothetical protein